jgi:hypothetical protein
MIGWTSVFLGSLASALFVLSFFLLRSVNWQAWAELFRRGVKYVRVTWGQMRPEDRQAYAMRAGIVVWYVVWSVAIVRGAP